MAEGLLLSSELNADTSSDKADRQRATIRAFGLRARHRATPQGVFASVAELGYDGTDDTLTIDGGYRTRTYPNPTWLHTVGDRAIDDPGVLRGLRFCANNCVTRRGDRLHVERPAVDARSRPDHLSISVTAPVEAIIDVCGRDFVTWPQISGMLRRRWPGLRTGTVETLLRNLVRNGFILTDLVPADVCNDPIAHLLTKIPETGPLHDTLAGLRAALTQADAHPPGSPDRLSALTRGRQLADELASVWRPIGVDRAVDAAVRIPGRLAGQAAEAVNALWRITSHHDRLASWHSRFIDKYGTRRLVPFLDACDPVTGLGCTLDDPAPAHLPDRHAALVELLSQALLSGSTRVDLTDSLIDALDQRTPSDRPEDSVELYTRVIAHSRQNGRYILAVTNQAAPAGSSRARFAGLLPDRLAEPDTGHGPMVAELVFQPQSHAVASLTGSGRGLPFRIPIAVAPRPDDLLLSDLALISDGHRLSLWSTQHHRPVHPRHRNQIGHHLMPELAAFLCVLGQTGTVPLALWDWGPFEHAPFLPQVRYRDTILAPARWRLPEAVKRAARDRATWDASLTQWRTAARPALPSVVAVADSDRHLPLDLDRDDDRELLRRYVTRGAVCVVEQPGGPNAVRGVITSPQGHRHGLEVVIPFTATGHPAAPPPEPAPTRQPGEGLHLPGGTWLSLAITAPHLTQDDILDRITELIGETTGLWDRWFWLRYHTHALGPHLRIRFHHDPHTLGGRLLPRLNELCGRLVDERLSGGFIVEPYAQEVERYGGPAAVRAVEEVFHHDSLLCLEMLGSHSETDARIRVAAVSAAHILRAVEANLSALEPFRLSGTDRATFDRLRPFTRRLADSDYLGCADVWNNRAAALDQWRAALPTHRVIDCTSSVVHMHANRMIGDVRAERIIRALAKDLIARRTR